MFAGGLRAMKKLWYEKYIGYCFSNNGKEVVLNNVYKREDGSICYDLSEKQEDGKYRAYTANYKSFREIVKQTNIPRV
jgi:hypothetical protein